MTAKPGRNDKCPCGSRKKYKHCHWERDQRPRERHVYFGLDEKPQAFATDQSGQPVLDEHGLPIVIRASGEIGRPDHVFTKTHYDRASGKEKVVDFVHGAAVPELPGYLASQFDLVFGIDTNTRPIATDSVSVCCFIECHVPGLIIGPEFNVFPFRNCQPGSEERFGWASVVRYVTEQPRYSNQTRVALVVDHDLGNHPKYESGELAIYGGAYLPENFKLVYASGDTGREGINGLISFCDKFSNEMLREFQSTGSSSVGGPPMSLHRVIDLRHGQDPGSDFMIVPRP